VPDTQTTTTKAKTLGQGSGKPIGTKVSGSGTRTASRR
jgi:hypothetical protein